jgi:hypothetical protein
MTRWKTINLPDAADDPDGYHNAVRLNSLGSLFYFTKFTLRKHRLTKLHWHLCNSLEHENLSLVMEVPMSHFKTTLGIGLSIWWALPFTEEDEEAMRGLGYKDAWIRYMRSIHDQNMRTLVTHEVADQAAAIGKVVDDAYYNNDLFMEVFKEIIPDRTCTWTNQHKFQRRLPGGDASTGTFEYRGVGQSVQGLHAQGIIPDDNFGKAAQDSLLKGDGKVVEDLIRWYQQVGTRFDPRVKDARRHLVIGNAWAHNDLNWWISKNQPHFKFETHSAEGGCCNLHPPGQPILPEEWTMERLAKERQRLGKYDYSHFYLNIRTLPEEVRFRNDYLRYFKFAQSRPDLQLDDLRNILLLRHEVHDGNVIEDFQPGALVWRMIVSVNHAKKVNSKTHCILVTGYDPESTRLYLLSIWSENSSYSDLVDEMFATAKRFEHWKRGSDFIWMTTTGAQLLKFYINGRNIREKKKIEFNMFPNEDESEGGRRNLVEALQPLFKQNQVWVQRNQEAFHEEFENYPASAMDILAALGCVPNTMDVADSRAAHEFMKTQLEAFTNRGSGQSGY